MVATNTSEPIASAALAVEVRNHPHKVWFWPRGLTGPWDLYHEVGLDMGIIFMYKMSMGWLLGHGMLPTGTFSSPASASSVVEVRDLHPEVGLGMLINLIYNMSM